MTPFLVIAVGLVGGYVLRKARKVPEGVPLALNAWILYVAMPAVIFQVVPRISWSWEAVFPLVTPVVVLGGAWAWGHTVGRGLGWDRDTRTAVVLTSGLGNTSFVGFPLILAYAGPVGLGAGVLVDQASFLLLATAGIGLAASAQAARGASGPRPGKIIASRILSFPPLVAFPLALVVPREFGHALGPLFEALGVTLAPLALFTVGIQLSFTQVRAGGRHLVAGLTYKLVVAPALVLGLALALGLEGLAVKIAVFEAAMAPMITSAVVAAEFGAAPRLANAMVGLGIPLSLATTALWWWVLGL